jgi:hypothetical protein
MNPKLVLYASESLASVQKQFRSHYPFLKLAFYSKTHNQLKGNNNKFICLDHTAAVSTFKPFDTPILITIANNCTAWELEEQFKTQLNMGVQVFYKQRQIWLETTISDQKSLFELNERGRLAENESNNPVTIEIPDYKELD